MKATLRAAGLVAAIAVGASVASPAFAGIGKAGGATASPDGLDAAKRLVTAQIDGRLAALHTMSSALGSVRKLTAAHKSALSGLVTADTNALNALRTKVAGETTVAAVRADATAMIRDYRVYLLLGPQVRLVAALDVTDAAVTTLRQVHDKLATAVAAAKQSGKDTTAAEAKLADLSAQLDAVTAATAGKAGDLLAVVPGADKTVITDAIKPIRDAVKSARTDLRTAVADAKAVRGTLH
jgi:hypothetical protein